MVKTKVIVIEGDTYERVKIVDTLSVEDDIDIVAYCSTGSEAIDAIRRNKPQLIFLSVHLSDMTGFDVLQNFHNETYPRVIILAQDPAYAIDAFEINAIDYILKPVSPERVKRAIDRYRTFFIGMTGWNGNNNKELVNNSPMNGNPLNAFLVREDERMLLIDVKEINWIEASGNYVILHCGQKKYRIRETMGKIERKLNPTMFIRIHRSAIVRIAKIKELQNWFNGDYCVILNDGTRLTLGSKYKEAFKSSFL
jgi:two-component system, LytTR family, response regulator